MAGNLSDFQWNKGEEDWHVKYNQALEDAQTQMNGKSESGHSHGAGGEVAGIGTSAARPATTVGYIHSEIDTNQVVVLDGAGGLRSTLASVGYVDAVQEEAVEAAVASAARQVVLRSDQAQPCEDYYFGDGSRSGKALVGDETTFLWLMARAGSADHDLRLKLHGELLEYDGGLGNACLGGAPFGYSYLAGYPYSLAFDQNSGTWWAGNLTGGQLGVEYLGCHFLTPQRIKQVYLQNMGTVGYNMPSVKLQYSVNGSDWYTIQTSSLSTAEGVIQTVEVLYDYPLASYFRILANASLGGNRWYVRDLRFLSGASPAAYNPARPTVYLRLGYAVVNGASDLDRYFPSRRVGLVSYGSGDLALSPNLNGYLYACSSPGVSDTSAPAFPTTVGASVSDGSCQWTNQGPAMDVSSSLVTMPAPGLATVVSFDLDAAQISDADDLIIGCLGRLGNYPAGSNSSCMLGVMDAYLQPVIA